MHCPRSIKPFWHDAAPVSVPGAPERGGPVLAGHGMDRLSRAGVTCDAQGMRLASHPLPGLPCVGADLVCSGEHG